MSPENKEAFDYITETFGGADGGLRFLKLRAMLECMDRQAAAGDTVSDDVILIMRRFERLIKVAQKY